MKAQDAQGGGALRGHPVKPVDAVTNEETEAWGWKELAHHARD